MKSIITLNGEVPFEIEKGCRMMTSAGKEFLVVRRLTTNSIEVKPYRWYHKLWRWIVQRRPTGFTVLQVILFILGSVVGNLLYRWFTQ
jgi:hypothetical protein